MTNIAIQAEGISKSYVIRHMGDRSMTLREAIVNGAKKLSPRGRRPRSLEQEEYWALKEVSFVVKKGETVGIIGRNGAGKSTLLKILSRVTEPTHGKISIRGRDASLLEVGTGFHPELSGRENIFLNGAILGMTRQEIKRKFDDIVAFSEVEKFLDTPVKRFSSGMYVRLAFAVAAHLEPDVLIVDEVLAVGDAQFQKKCLGKMGDVAKEGRTVLFVSHSMGAVHTLCSTCMWIDEGKVRKIGPTEEVIRAYSARFNPSEFTGVADLKDWTSRYGDGRVRILSARLLDEAGDVTNTVYRSRPMTVEFVVDGEHVPGLQFSAVMVAASGVKALHLSHTDTPGLELGKMAGRHVVRFTVPSLPLCAGNYSMILGIHTTNMMAVDVVTDILPFIAQDAADSRRPYRTTVSDGYCTASNHWSFTPVP